MKEAFGRGRVGALVTKFKQGFARPRLSPAEDHSTVIRCATLVGAKCYFLPALIMR